MSNTNRIFVAIAILSIILMGCNKQNYNKLESRDISFIYKPGSTTLHPEFFAYHKSDTSTLLFFKLKPSELAKSIDEESQRIYFMLKLQCTIYDYNDLNSPVDTVSVVIKSFNYGDEDYITYLPLKIPDKQKFYIEIISTDLNNNNKTQNFVTIDKSSENGEQNFMVSYTDNFKPVFGKTISSERKIKIENSRNLDNDIFIRYYASKIPAPMPPYFISTSKILEISYDSIWYIKNYRNQEMSFASEGIYFFQNDTTTKEGIALYNFNKYYPKVKSPKQMLGPLVYLTTYRELKQLESYKNIKYAVDSFWLKTAGDVEKARELIRVYYNRVQLANNYFTSFTEGWNTDRGMIFIVLGPPKNVYKSNDMEKWSYGHRTNQPVLEFTFYKFDNALTTNNYALQRDELYSQVWNQAVDTWRGGLIYSIAE